MTAPVFPINRCFFRRCVFIKKFLCILLSLCIVLSLCACSGAGYGVKTVLTLAEQEYSLAFRTGDDTYYYVTAALQQLDTNGTVNELTRKWFGDDIVSFPDTGIDFSNFSYPESRTLIIGVDENSFPLAYVSDGYYWGFDVQLAQSVCELLGWELQIQSIEKEDVYIELSSGNIDVAWGGVALDEEEVAAGKYTQFGPYIHNDIVIAAREGSGVWNSLRLNGRNMTMPSTTEASDALASDEKLSRRLGQITRLAGGTVECFTYLYSGKCDAVLTDSTALYYYNSH